MGTARRDGGAVPCGLATGRVRGSATGRGLRPTGERRGFPAGRRASGGAIPGRGVEDGDLKNAGADPHDLVLELSAHVERFSTEWVMCDEAGRQMGPWQLQRAFRAARSRCKGLPEGFRFHDLRHFYASLLISKDWT